MPLTHTVKAAMKTAALGDTEAYFDFKRLMINMDAKDYLPSDFTNCFEEILKAIPQDQMGPFCPNPYLLIDAIEYYMQQPIEWAQMFISSIVKLSKKDKGNIGAQRAFLRCVLSGTITLGDQQAKQDVYALILASDHGNPIACVTRGLLLQNTTRTNDPNPKFSEAEEWYTQAVEQGDSDALYYLGMMCEKGYITDDKRPDYTRAANYYDKASEAFPHPKALFQRGTMYLRGCGEAEKKPNFEQTHAVLTRAVQLGNPDAMTLLGRLLQDPKSGMQDPSKAIALLEMAIVRENSQAMYIRAQMLLSDSDSSTQQSSKERAIKLLKTSAGKGFSEALGRLKELGYNVQSSQHTQGLQNPGGATPMMAGEVQQLKKALAARELQLRQAEGTIEKREAENASLKEQIGLLKDQVRMLQGFNQTLEQQLAARTMENETARKEGGGSRPSHAFFDATS